MPQYEHPGVYIEEIPSGAKPIEGVSTSTAGFVGVTERGSLRPTLITSYRDFVDAFGADPEADLTYAMRGYFENGGRQVYVCRVASASSTTASTAFGPHFTVRATGPGRWAERVYARIEPGSSRLGFRLRVAYYESEPVGDPFDWFEDAATAPAPAYAEDFDELVLDAASHNDWERQFAGAKLVRLVRDPAAPPDSAPEFGSRRLTGGDDGAALGAEDFDGGAAPEAEPRGLAALAECPDVALVHVPGASIDVARRVIAHCEALRHRFAVLDAPRDLPAGFEPREAIGVSCRAALYAPWLLVSDLADPHGSRAVPPGGHVAGVYVRTDLARGVHKAPASEAIRGATGVTEPIDAAAQEQFNPRGVNVLREFQGRGLRIWGARTLSADGESRYVNVRRLFIFLEHSIERGTQWVVFEPNDERTWARVRDSIRNFLRTVWRDGALLGNTENEAYFVRCDRTTMTQADVDQGRLICVVGAAPIKPAEFIVFRIGQYIAAWTA